MHVEFATGEIQTRRSNSCGISAVIEPCFFGLPSEFERSVLNLIWCIDIRSKTMKTVSDSHDLRLQIKFDVQHPVAQFDLLLITVRD